MNAIKAESFLQPTASHLSLRGVLSGHCLGVFDVALWDEMAPNRATDAKPIWQHLYWEYEVYLVYVQLLQQTKAFFITSPGSSNQLLSPECWKVTLRVLGCLPPSRSIKSKAEQALTTTDTPGRAAGPQASPHRSPVSLSPQQVTHVNAVSIRLRHSSSDSGLKLIFHIQSIMNSLILCCFIGG